MFRNAHEADTSHYLIDAGLMLGLACPRCPHRVIFDLSKVASDPLLSGVKYVLDQADLDNFYARKHPTGHQHKRLAELRTLH